MFIEYATLATPRIRTHRRKIVVGACILLVLMLVFVYPTPFSYQHSKGVLVRVNRFTGTAHKLTDDGWQKMRPWWEQDKPATP